MIKIFIFFEHIKRELLKITKYDNDACLAEEKHFLKNYTIPFIQLEPLKSILVFSHKHNTFDTTKESNKKIDDFVKEPELKDFFLNIDNKLKDYKPGEPNMKPDVIKQILDISKKRELNNQNKIPINFDNKNMNLSIIEINQLLNNLLNDNKMLSKEIHLVKQNYNNLLNQYTMLLNKK